MRIVQIDLENVKSYQQEHITFTGGANAICGPNGAGKSTLLEAVGFALFDFLATTQDQFVREGAKAATVTVHLADDEGRIYQVVRKCGNYSQHYVYDAEIGQKLTNGKSETMTWLYQFLGVQESGDLAALFQDAVGVPQGLLTAAFLDRPANRKNTFNPLLRVDEYEKVWSLLRETRSRLEQNVNETEKQIASLQAEVKVLPSLQEKASDLSSQIQADKKRQSEQQSALEKTSQQKQAWQAIKKQLDKLTQAAVRVEDKVNALNAQLTAAQSAVEQARAAQAVVSETRAGYQAYQTAQENLSALEKQRSKRDNLKQKLNKQRTDLALAQQQIQGLEQELETIAEAAAKMAALHPRVEKQEQLETQLSQAQRAADRLSDAKKNLAQERKRLSALKDKLDDVQTKLEELAPIEEKIKTAQLELERLDKQHNELTLEQATYQAEQAQITEQTTALEIIETAQCPICEGPLTPKHRSELLARNQTRQTELRTSLDELESQKKALEKSKSERRKTQRKLEKQAKALPRPREVDDLAEQIKAQKQSVAQVQAQVEQLAAAPAEVERLQNELSALGNPRRDHQRAADAAKRRDHVEKSRDQARQQAGQLDEKITTSASELQVYVHLDQDIQMQRATLDTQAHNQQRYLRQVDTAAELGERQAKAQTLHQELESAQAGYDQLIKEREQIAADYDDDAFQTLSENYTALRDELATLKERLRQQSKQLAQTKADVERLQAAETELAATQGEHDELAELLALLNHLRGVLRDAGPLVTQALVAVISSQAARLYAEVMSDHSTNLQWTKDYEIILSSDGRKRGFSQLSGGEQMAAALAVRLALLREVSDIDVAFFDEPTANLDEQRRDNLAEQIIKVKGFAQLFVISHDDTFERDTDHVIRVSKENGVSRACPALPVLPAG